MPRFAVLNGVSIVNFIIADTKEIAEDVSKATCIECDASMPLSVGNTYNFETGLFDIPVTNE